MAANVEKLLAHPRTLFDGPTRSLRRHSTPHMMSTGSPVVRKNGKAAAHSIGIDSTTHDLRHHCASALISSGVSITVVQCNLGHQHPSETLETHGHLMPGDDDRVRMAIDASLRQGVRSMWAQGSTEAQ